MNNRPEIKQLDDICVQSEVLLNSWQRDSLLFILHDLFLLAVPELPSHNPSSVCCVEPTPPWVEDSRPRGLHTRAAQMSPRRSSHLLLITTILTPALQGTAPVTTSKAALLPRTSLPRGTNTPVLSGPHVAKEQVLNINNFFCALLYQPGDVWLGRSEQFWDFKMHFSKEICYTAAVRRAAFVPTCNSDNYPLRTLCKRCRSYHANTSESGDSCSDPRFRGWRGYL